MARKRPDWVKPPDHLSEDPPVPEPAEARAREEAGERIDPTRYGDWQRKGICRDF